MGTTAFDRITQTPDIMGGKPCVKGTRVTAGMIVGEIGAGTSIDALLTDYPYLERADVMQALRYAAWRVQECEMQAVSDAITFGNGKPCNTEHPHDRYWQ